MVHIALDDEQVKHIRFTSHHRDSAFSYLQKTALDKQCLELSRRVGFFSHLLKLLFLEADLVVLLVRPALPEPRGSDALQL